MIARRNSFDIFSAVQAVRSLLRSSRQHVKNLASRDQRCFGSLHGSERRNAHPVSAPENAAHKQVLSGWTREPSVSLPSKEAKPATLSPVATRTVPARRRLANSSSFSDAAFQAAHDDYITTFFITDFLARHFDTFLKRPLGLDRHPELRDAYFGNYERALYLAQTDDPDLDARARDAANYLGLRYERVFTGYGDLTDAMRALGGGADG